MSTVRVLVHASQRYLRVLAFLLLAALPGQWPGGATTGPERTRPHFNIATIGHAGHGKTALTAAIDRITASRFGGDSRTYEELAGVEETRSRGVTLRMARVEYGTERAHYSHVDWPRHADVVKGLITGAARPDAAVLVVSAVDGATPHTREHVLLARQVGIAYIVVYLDGVDLVADEARLERVETQVRELLDRHEYPGDDTPIIRGSASRALRGDDSAVGEGSILALLDALEEYVPKPARAVDGPFLLPVEDVFAIAGRGTVVTGRVERGVLRVGEEVELVGLGATRRATSTGIEMFRKRLDRAVAGDNVGVLFQALGREDVRRGQVLATPGSISAHSRFEAQLYVLSKDEGGRHTPIFGGYRPQLYFRTTDVTGRVGLPQGAEMVMPGDYGQVTVSLTTPVAMEEGLRFAMREGGRSVAVGVVARILE